MCQEDNGKVGHESKRTSISGKLRQLQTSPYAKRTMMRFYIGWREEQSFVGVTSHSFVGVDITRWLMVGS